MSALFFLLLAVVVAGVGCTVLYLRQRVPTSLDSGIDSFRREMQALSGAGGDGARQPHGHQGSVAVKDDDGGRRPAGGLTDHDGGEG